MNRARVPQSPQASAPRAVKPIARLSRLGRRLVSAESGLPGWRLSTFLGSGLCIAWTPHLARYPYLKYRGSGQPCGRPVQFCTPQIILGLEWFSAVYDAEEIPLPARSYLAVEDYVTIRRCAGSSAERQRRVAQPRRARWVASKRDGSQRPRTCVPSLSYPALGSTAFGRHAQRLRSCSIWIPA
jgi:hypothetical protein